MVNINDVAKRAKVAKSTVSLVCNNSGYVSEKTRQKVLDAMAELNYVPNQLAKNFNSSKSNIIGIVMPDLLHPFFATFVKHAEQRLHQLGYMTMVCSTVSQEEIEQKYIDMLNRKGMDGIIMGSHSLDVQHYANNTNPIVMLDRFVSEQIPVVRSNHQLAAQRMVEILQANHCKKVIQLVGSLHHLKANHDFPCWCKKYAAQAGIELELVQLQTRTFTPQDYSQKVEEIFSSGREFDAIIGVDLAVMAAYKQALAHNRRVPEDLKLVAFDGTFITRMGPHVITAVLQRIEELAHTCVDVLIQRIQGQQLSQSEFVVDGAVQAGSTAELPTSCTPIVIE